MSCDPAPHELRQIGEALAAREIPADELAEAEHAFRIAVPDSFGVDAVPDWAVQLYMAEYDVRGRERDAARAEVERLRTRDEAAKAVMQAWYERIAPARTQRMEHLVRMFIGNVLADKLDELARAHEARDGGRDR